MNKVGALRCSVQTPNGCLREVATTSGMTDKIRDTITSKDFYRVVELKYQNIGSKGRLRHPRFLRWRDDKKPDECTEDQI